VLPSSGRTLMRHLVALVAALLAVIVVGSATVQLGRRAAAESARVTAIFPPGITAEAMLARVALADGRLIRDTLLPFAVEVAGDAPGIAARLEAAGALVVIARLPSDGLAIGGCSYLPAAAYPALRERIRSAPL